MIFPKVERAAYIPASVAEKKCLTKIKSVEKREVTATSWTKTGIEKLKIPLVSGEGPKGFLKKSLINILDTIHADKAANTSPKIAPTTENPKYTNRSPITSLVPFSARTESTICLKRNNPCNTLLFNTEGSRKRKAIALIDIVKGFLIFKKDAIKKDPMAITAAIINENIKNL